MDQQVPDSAATATAMFCGIKTKDAMIGLSARAQIDNCSSVEGNKVQSILIDAYNAGVYNGCKLKLVNKNFEFRRY